MKKDWEIKQLGELGKVSMCKRILKKQTSPIGDIPFYKIGTFGKIPNAFISKEVYEEYRSKYSFPKKGAILLSASGTIGRCVIYDGKPAYFQDSNIVWIDNNEKKVSNEYLYKFYGFCNWNPSKGATISRLYNDNLRKIKIPVPTLPEQKRIVKILDKAFTAIDKTKENAEKNLQSAKELFESYLNGILVNGKLKVENGEWEEKKLGEVIKLEYGKPLDKSFRTSDGKYPAYGANGIKARTNKYYYDQKTIIVGRKGSAGEINLTAEKFWPLDVTYFVKYDDKKMNLSFLFFLLSKLNLPTLAKGVKPGINRNDVYSINVKFPPLLEQKQIVKKLDALQTKTKRLEKIYQQKIADVEELKKSVLQKAFEGGL